MEKMSIMDWIRLMLYKRNWLESILGKLHKLIYYIIRVNIGPVKVAAMNKKSTFQFFLRKYHHFCYHRGTKCFLIPWECAGTGYRYFLMERRWDDGGWPWVSIIISTQIPTQSGAQYQTKWEQQKQTTLYCHSKRPYVRIKPLQYFCYYTSTSLCYISLSSGCWNILTN